MKASGWSSWFCADGKRFLAPSGEQAERVSCSCQPVPKPTSGMQAPVLFKQQAEEGRVVFPLPVPLLAGRSSFWAHRLVPAVCRLTLSRVGGKGLGT